MTPPSILFRNAAIPIGVFMSVPPLSAALCPACGSLLHRSVSLVAAPETVMSCGNCGLSIAEAELQAKPKHPDEVAKISEIRPMVLRPKGISPGARVLDRSAVPHGLRVADAVMVAEADGPVDAILAVHSLAATADPAALLARFRQDLVPGGQLYVEVPAGRVAGFPLTFTKKGLMLLMERMGFRLVTKVRRKGGIAGWFRRY